MVLTKVYHACSVILYNIQGEQKWGEIIHVIINFIQFHYQVIVNPLIYIYKKEVYSLGVL